MVLFSVITFALLWISLYTWLRSRPKFIGLLFQECLLCINSLSWLKDHKHIPNDVLIVGLNLFSNRGRVAFDTNGTLAGMSFSKAFHTWVNYNAQVTLCNWPLIDSKAFLSTSNLQWPLRSYFNRFRPVHERRIIVPQWVITFIR